MGDGYHHKYCERSTISNAVCTCGGLYSEITDLRYQRDRARELLEQTEVRFNYLLAEHKEALDLIAAFNGPQSPVDGPSTSE